MTVIRLYGTHEDGVDYLTFFEDEREDFEHHRAIYMADPDYTRVEIATLTRAEIWKELKDYVRSIKVTKDSLPPSEQHYRLFVSRMLAELAE